MEKREQDMLERIRSASDGLQVPEALAPDQIRKKLEEAGAAGKEEEPGRTKQEKEGKVRLFLRSARGRQLSVLAAGLVLVCLAGAAWTLAGRSGAGSADALPAAGEETARGEGGQAASGSADGEALRTAESYDEIYAYLEAYQQEQESRDFKVSSRGASAADGGVESAASTAADSASAYAGSYSDTNVRQEGVGEADIVKTDGRWIYTLSDDCEIGIADTEGGLTEAGVICEDRQIREFYVQDDRLMLLASAGEDGSGTALVTYDISDRGNPEKIGEVTQSGDYQSSRLVGDHLYVFSLFYADMYAGPEARESYIPQAGGMLLKESSIWLPDRSDPSQYLVMTSTDIQAPDRLVDSQALFAGYGEVYVSNENIYWYEAVSRNTGLGWVTDTQIRKVSYQDGHLKVLAKGTVPGYINDSFSIDEYGGNLRVVTTDERDNGLYILGPDLEELGSIENLAKDEQVYSARLMGDTGYFVTFRNTDPLFSVDLSDPEDPQVLGELKIPGFSEYLHPYGDGLLLGIGMDADEETGATGGMKLSMFDVSDPANVQEKDTFVMENVYSGDVLYDYRAALVDPERNLIGFSAYDGARERYYVFSYDRESGFTCRMEARVSGAGYSAARGLYIGDVLYVVKGNIIEMYRMEDYKKTGDLIL